MSYRGRSRGGNNYGKRSTYPYRGNGNKFSQHDDRPGGSNYDRDQESGEYYNNNNREFGRYVRRGRGGGKYRGRRPSGRRGGPRGRGPPPHGGYQNTSSNRNFVDDDGDIDMDGTRSRMKPYARPTRGQRGSRHEGRGSHQDRRHEPRWSLITVVDGGSFDQAWVVEAIQKEVMLQITPVQYYTDGQNASFCIQDEETAQAIRGCSKKIQAPDGSKLMILKTHISPPIMDDKLPILQEVLSQRYTSDTCHLDASSLFFDQKLKDNRIELKLRYSKDMYILIRMIGEHITGLLSLDLSSNNMDTLAHLKNLVIVTPRLKSLKLAKNFLKHAKELDHIREWNLSELNLDGNPLCGNYQTQTDYISAMRDKFPNLQTLDGKKLPPPVKFDLEKVTKLVPPIQNHIPSQVTEIIKQFVKQYFALYDKDRDSLLQAYDEKCIFSLTIPTSARGSPLSVYYSHSRNLSRMKNPKTKISTLRHTNTQVCSILKELPRTEHDVAGFSVDVPLVSQNMIKFIIRGVFKEKYAGRERTSMRAFSRSFLCLTDGTRLSIINEELYIRNTTSAELRSAFAKPPVTPSPSPVPEHSNVLPAPSAGAVANVTSPTKMDMVAAFSKESGMNVKYSEQCLMENGWNYNAAGQAFLSAKEKGLIPPEAFAN